MENKIDKNIEQEKQKPQRKEFIIPETVYLAAIPLLAYGLLYSYESNYLGYFGIPYQFLSFELPELLILFIGIIFVYIIGIFFWVNNIYMFFSSVKSTVIKKKLLFSSIITFITGVTLLLIVPPNPALFWGTFLILILVFWLDFILPLFAKHKGSYIQKLEEREQAKGKVPESKNLFIILFQKLNPNILIISVCYYWVYLTVGYAGTNMAYYQSKFDVIKTNSECVVVYTKSDRFICLSDVDKQKKEFTKSYQVYYLQDLKGVSIVEESIGPLREKPSPTSTPTNTPITPTSTVTTPVVNKTP